MKNNNGLPRIVIESFNRLSFNILTYLEISVRNELMMNLQYTYRTFYFKIIVAVLPILSELSLKTRIDILYLF